MTASASHALRRFSTDDLPAPDQLSVWREVFGRTVMKAHFEPIEGRALRERTSMLALDNLGLVVGETNGVLGWRDKALTANCTDDLVFHTNVSGFSFAAQAGHELRLSAGEALLFTDAEPLSHAFPEAMRCLTLRIPRRTLAVAVPDPEDARMRRVPASTPALRLLVDYVTMVMERHELESAPLQQAFTTHIHDLVALTLGATRDATGLAQSRGLRAARLHAIKLDISRRFSDEGLSVGDIARRHGVTPRYVHMLFEAEGRTFTEFVIERRLSQAHCMLTDPHLAGRNISSIAFEVGFANLSYFNRVFRRRYGASPSDIREAARRARE